MNKVALFTAAMIFLASGCDNFVGPDDTPREQLSAKITGIYACDNASSVGCTRGPAIDRPISGEPFIITADVDYARNVWWFLEWPRCRQIEVCASTRRIGPLGLVENRELSIAIMVTDDRPWWVIIRAELEPEVVADTLEITWE